MSNYHVEDIPAVLSDGTKRRLLEATVDRLARSEGNLIIELYNLGITAARDIPVIHRLVHKRRTELGF